MSGDAPYGQAVSTFDNHHRPHLRLATTLAASLVLAGTLGGCDEEAASLRASEDCPGEAPSEALPLIEDLSLSADWLEPGQALTVTVVAPEALEVVARLGEVEVLLQTQAPAPGEDGLQTFVGIVPVFVEAGEHELALTARSPEGEDQLSVVVGVAEGKAEPCPLGAALGVPQLCLFGNDDKGEGETPLPASPESFGELPLLPEGEPLPEPAELDCSVPQAPGAVPGNVVVPANFQGGVVRATGKITVPNAIFPAGDVTLIADGDVVVSGLITMPNNAAQPSHVTLVSLKGDVIIDSIVDGTDGLDHKLTRIQANAGVTVQGQHGGLGGWVKIVGQNVTFKAGSQVWGGDGGDGEALDLRSNNASAIAHAGSGGHAGLVHVCAVNQVTVDGTITAGAGGIGGSAFALAGNTGWARARGGKGGANGSVVFEGIGKGLCSVAVNAPGAVALPRPIVGVGRANEGGDADAFGGPLGSMAEGGDAGRAGSVEFLQCVPVNNAMARVQGTPAAKGGDARAEGDAGQAPQVDGGVAIARGGRGGDPDNLQGLAGPGGEATAEGGNGDQGGRSGSSDALGGTSGSGKPGQRALIQRQPPLPNGQGGRGVERNAKGGLP